jgi:nucleotide-binding universal stress UspA family protein
VFRHLLVPLDGSPEAEAVLPLTATLALGLQAQVTLLHVLDPAGPAAGREIHRLQDPEDAQAYLAGLARSPLFMGAAVRVHVHGGPDPGVAASIRWHAEEWGADLILLAPRRKPWRPPLGGGGVTRQVLRRGRTSLLLVRPGPSTDEPRASCRTILMALDLSHGSDPAIPLARDLARALSARLCFVQPVPNLGTLAACPVALYLPLSMRAVLDREAEEAAAALREVEAGCRARGIWTRSYVRRGSLSGVLAELTQSLRTDLLVMRTRPSGPREAFSVGSVTPQLLRTPGPPLLLLRADPEALYSPRAHC